MYQQFKEVEKNKHNVAETYAICAYRHYSDLRIRTEAEIEEIKATDKEEARKVREFEAMKEDKVKRQAEIKKEIHKVVSEKLSAIEKELSGERKKVATHEATLESASSFRAECEVKLNQAQKAHDVEVKQVEAYNRKSGNALQEFENIKSDIENAKVKLAAAQHR